MVRDRWDEKEDEGQFHRTQERTKRNRRTRDLFFLEKARRQRCAGVHTVQENESKHGCSICPVGAQETASRGGARVLECLRNRAPPPPEGTRHYNKQQRGLARRRIRHRRQRKKKTNVGSGMRVNAFSSIQWRIT